MHREHKKPLNNSNINNSTQSQLHVQKSSQGSFQKLLRNKKEKIKNLAEGKHLKLIKIHKIRDKQVNNKLIMKESSQNTYFANKF